MPKQLPSSEDTDVMIARVAPAVLALLGDGVPRSRRAIVAAIGLCPIPRRDVGEADRADRHPRDEVRRTLMRLAVTDQVVEAGGKYGLATAKGADQP